MLAHLIESHLRAPGSLEAAIRAALSEVTGAYAICVVSSEEPDIIYAAKTASPLIIGLGEGENFLASDIPAVMGYTRDVLVLEDGDFARITPAGRHADDAGRRSRCTGTCSMSPGMCPRRRRAATPTSC